MSPVAKHVGISTLIFGAACVFLGFTIKSATPEVLTSALTNLAAVGGVTSGLSFAALSIFTLNGTYHKKVLEHVGDKVRGVLFYMLFIVMLVSVFSGIAVVWAGSPWMRYTFPVLVFFVVEPFYITFRITFTAYEWESEPVKPDPIDPEYVKH